VVVTVIAYVVALELTGKRGIFEIAIRFAFSGFAAMAPIMIGALFWKRSTKWGALASTIFVAASLVGFAMLQGKPAAPPTPPAAKPATIAVAQTNALLGQTNLSTNAVTNATAAAVVPPGTNAPTKPVIAAAAPAVKPKVDVIWQVGDKIILSRVPTTGDVRFWNSTGTPTGGFMTVVPMVFGSALCMILFSLLTKPPGRATIEKYFTKTQSTGGADGQ